ncbi:unnamed protein product [Urochloa decumbens]|uniref:Uncharacterized protein n=1 Tax=Urochloa decumbens TaxID=240449 RepID=A0ABC9B4C9_9POAL
MATADAPDNHAAASYYSGRPLNYDPQQAQVVVPTPEPPQPPSAVVVDRANAPPEGAGEQASNHTQVHGVPGYYSARLKKNANTVAPAPSPPAAAAAVPAVASAPSPAAAAAPPPPATNQKELGFMDKILMCFKGGKNEK